MAQSRFGNAQHPAGSREATAINHLHKVEEVVQIKHAWPHRPPYWTLSSISANFSADCPAPTFCRVTADERGWPQPIFLLQEKVCHVRPDPRLQAADV